MPPNLIKTNSAPTFNFFFCFLRSNFRFCESPSRRSLWIKERKGHSIMNSIIVMRGSRYTSDVEVYLYTQCIRDSSSFFHSSCTISSPSFSFFFSICMPSCLIYWWGPKIFKNVHFHVQDSGRLFFVSSSALRTTKLFSNMKRHKIFSTWG